MIWVQQSFYCAEQVWPSPPSLATYIPQPGYSTLCVGSHFLTRTSTCLFRDACAPRPSPFSSAR
jgi:hypothetical protein